MSCLEGRRNEPDLMAQTHGSDSLLQGQEDKVADFLAALGDLTFLSQPDAKCHIHEELSLCLSPSGLASASPSFSASVSASEGTYGSTPTGSSGGKRPHPSTTGGVAGPSATFDEANQTKCSLKRRRRFRRGSSNLPDDGQHWRKYGQKDLNDSPYVRSYYWCAQKQEGCLARRWVDRHTGPQGGVRISYEGHHNHAPPIRDGHKVVYYALAPGDAQPTLLRHQSEVPADVPGYEDSKPVLPPDGASLLRRASAPAELWMDATPFELVPFCSLSPALPQQGPLAGVKQEPGLELGQDLHQQEQPPQQRQPQQQQQPEGVRWDTVLRQSEMQVLQGQLALLMASQEQQQQRRRQQLQRQQQLVGGGTSPVSSSPNAQEGLRGALQEGPQEAGAAATATEAAATLPAAATGPSQGRADVILQTQGQTAHAAGLPPVGVVRGGLPLPQPQHQPHQQQQFSLPQPNQAATVLPQGLGQGHRHTSQLSAHLAQASPSLPELFSPFDSSSRGGGGGSGGGGGLGGVGGGAGPGQPGEAPELGEVRNRLWEILINARLLYQQQQQQQQQEEMQRQQQQDLERQQELERQELLRLLAAREQFCPPPASAPDAIMPPPLLDALSLPHICPLVLPPTTLPVPRPLHQQQLPWQGPEEGAEASPPGMPGGSAAAQRRLLHDPMAFLGGRDALSHADFAQEVEVPVLVPGGADKEEDTSWWAPLLSLPSGLE